MLGLCRLVRDGAPALWSAFLRYSSKAAVADLVRDEEAFAYFDFFGSPRVMHFLTRVGVSPKDANANYCLDLDCDIDCLRKLDDVELAERLAQEPKPVRRLKINASPLLYPLWHPQRAPAGSVDSAEGYRACDGASVLRGQRKPISIELGDHNAVADANEAPADLVLISPKFER